MRLRGPIVDVGEPRTVGDGNTELVELTVRPERGVACQEFADTEARDGADGAAKADEDWGGGGEAHADSPLCPESSRRSAMTRPATAPAKPSA